MSQDVATAAGTAGAAGDGGGRNGTGGGGSSGGGGGGGRTRNMWNWLGLNLGKHAGVVTLIGLVVTVVLGLGIAQLSFVTSNASYLNNNDRAQIENQAYEKYFGGDPMVTMFTMKPGTTIDDLFTPHNVAEFQKVQAQLKADPSVFSAITPLDAIDLSNTLSTSADGNPTDSMAGKLLLSAYERDPNPASKAIRQKDLLALASAEEAFPPSERVLSNPRWVHFLAHNPDGTMRASSATFLPNNQHAAMTVFLKGNLSIDQESAAAATVNKIMANAHFDNTTTLTTGVPALLKTINDYLKRGMLTLGGIAAVVMIIILILLFNVRWRLLPFVIVTIGLIWGFGLVGYFGIPLTLASVAGLPILLGVGIDYAIQMHSRVEEEVILDRAAHPIQATARHLGPALLVVTFDAVFAFLALTFAKVPMIRQFGWLLVVSVIAVCVCSIIGPLAILGIREYKSPTTGRDFSQGRLGRLTGWLGSVPPRAALPFAIAAVVIFGAGLAVEGHVTMQTDPLQWVDPSSPTVADVHALKAGTGTENEISALVRTNAPWSDQTVAYVTTFSNEETNRFPDLLFPATGMVNLVSEFTAVPGTTTVPPLGHEVQSVYAVSPEDIRHTTVADGGRALGIVFRSKTSTLEQLQPVVDHMQNNLHPPAGITVAPGGIAVVGVGLLDNLARSRTLLTYLAMIFVGVFLALRLRSITRSLLSLIPVAVAVGSVTLIAWAASLKLSPLTSVSGPLVIAVCTEFTSLILLRFVEERARGESPEDSMRITATRTGRAFIVSGLTAVAGVTVIATSPWPLLRGFGTIVGLNVLVALACALVILPPILVWAESGGRNWVSRRLVTVGSEPPKEVRAPEGVPVGSAPARAGGTEPPPAVAGGAATT